MKISPHITNGQRLIQSLFSIFSKTRREIVKKITALNIEEYGVNDEMPYIRLKTGEVFYGYLPSRGQTLQYYVHYFKLSKKIPLSAFSVATDIVIRYHGYGLKYGGPSKEMFYRPKEGDAVAEMGAYLGHYILRLSRSVGPNGKVFAIEPIPQNLKRLQMVIAENQLNNVILIPYGVSDTNGRAFIKIEDNGGQANSLSGTGASVKKQIPITTRTLHAIFIENNITHLDFMIIQLNGNEINALKGLGDITASNMSIAARYSTTETRNPQQEILSLMHKNDYFTKVIDNDFIFISKNSPFSNKY